MDCSDSSIELEVVRLMRLSTRLRTSKLLDQCMLQNLHVLKMLNLKHRNNAQVVAI